MKKMGKKGMKGLFGGGMPGGGAMPDMAALENMDPAQMKDLAKMAGGPGGAMPAGLGKAMGGLPGLGGPKGLPGLTGKKK